MPAIKNFTNVVVGQSLPQQVFGIKRYAQGTLIDLTGAIVKFQVFRSETSPKYIDIDSSGNPGEDVDIVNALECVIKVNQIDNLTLTAGKYYWRLVVEYTDGTVKIPVGGKIDIVTIKELSDA